jgi:hypothetical protein
MKKPNFFEGVAVALIIAVVSAAATFVAAQLFFSDTLLYLLIAVISFAYICYLLARSGEKTGRVSVIIVWFFLSLAGFLFLPSFIFFAVLQLGFIWLLRSLYFHNSVLAAIADLGLFMLALIVAAWSWFNTQSVFISVWSFFLTQALFVLIPSRTNSSSKTCVTGSSAGDRFETAYRAAENAVRKLATH